MNIRLGEINNLKVVKQVPFGYYLDGGRIHGEILLPQNEVVGNVIMGEDVEVFLYLDQEERLIATMRKPLAQVGDFAFLEVAWVNNFGAFLNWGLMKDLFVPFREQKMKMVKGQSYIVHIHLDEDSSRIMASAKVERYLDPGSAPYRRGDEVDILVWQKTDLGFKVIIDNQWGGLLYDSQVFRELHTGVRTRAYINKVRQDGKIDVTLSRQGQEGVSDFSDVLLAYIQENGGHCPLGDKSPAETIAQTFNVSKKVFKKAVGDLYKRRLITISDDGLRLV
jgi:predicted RNA-binding protein (virulence factor B family)